MVHNNQRSHLVPRTQSVETEFIENMISRTTSAAHIPREENLIVVNYKLICFCYIGILKRDRSYFRFIV